jgi:hypothetical protein
MKLTSLLAALALSGTVAVAYAQHSHDGPNGGHVEDIATGHLEFTHSSSAVTLYLTDKSDKPLNTADAKAGVVIQNKGKTEKADLASSAPNKLVAQISNPLAKGAVVVVSGTVGGKAVQARYTVK